MHFSRPKYSITISLLCYRPVDSRREVWIKNSGNENEGIDWNRRKMFCEDHFDPKFLRRQFNRTTLRRDAVPYVYSADLQEVGE